MPVVTKIRKILLRPIYKLLIFVSRGAVSGRSGGAQGLNGEEEKELMMWNNRPADCGRNVVAVIGRIIVNKLRPGEKLLIREVIACRTM